VLAFFASSLKLQAASLMKPLIFSILAGVFLVAAMGFIGLRPWEHSSEPSIVSASSPSTTVPSESMPGGVSEVADGAPGTVSDQEFQPGIEPPRQSLMATTRFSPRSDGLETSYVSSRDDSQSADSAEHVPYVSSGVPPNSSGGSAGAVNPVVLDPSIPGNSFTFRGNQVALESMQPSSDGNATDLSLAVTPLNSSQNAARNSAAADPLKNGAKNPSGSRSRGRGFTLEEERFRTKWGWAAFSEAQSAAAQ
jgi:hypothetical protein